MPTLGRPPHARLRLTTDEVVFIINICLAATGILALVALTFPNSVLSAVAAFAVAFGWGVFTLDTLGTTLADAHAAHASRDAAAAQTRGDFGVALAHLRLGFSVARDGWQLGTRLVLVPGSAFTVAAGRPLGDAAPDLIGRKIRYWPHIDMVTADGNAVPWSPATADLLAEDWTVTPHPSEDAAQTAQNGDQQ